MYSPYEFLYTLGPLVFGLIAYEYCKLILENRLKNRLFQLFCSGVFTYLFIAAVYYLILKDTRVGMVVIPIILVLSDLWVERRQIFSSKEEYEKFPPKESPLKGLKYKTRDGLKTVHPLLASFIIVVVIYLIYLLMFYSLDKLI